MNELRKKSMVKASLAISLFFVLVIPLINAIGIEFLEVKSSTVYGAVKEIEFIDEEFKKSIKLTRDINLPLDSDRIWEPLSQEDINNMEFVIIHEDFNPDSYEDIYMFPNVRKFSSWDMDMTMEQIVEIDRYIKSIDLKGTTECLLDSRIKENKINFSNPLTEKVLKELASTEKVTVGTMYDLLLKGIKLKASLFNNESKDQMVDVINELINNDYINLIDYSQLDIDLSNIEELDSSNLIIENGIIRKKHKYEKDNDISYIDLTDSTKWYYNGIMLLTKNKIMEGSIMGGDRYACPESVITNGEAITLAAKALKSKGTVIIADMNEDEKWYERYYNAIEVTTEEYIPSESMSRYEFANLMKLLTEEKVKELDMEVAYNNAEAKFLDWNQIPKKYKEGIAVLLELGITNGTANKDGEIIYNGDETLTRGMAATFIQRLMEVIS